MVSTLSIMFGLSLGYSDEILLADMATAGLFHDIGLTRVNPLIVAKKEESWTAQEMMGYQEHVNTSVMILKEANAEYNKVVFIMVEEHHENYDGSGLPKRKSGLNIGEPSQIIHLANWFDRISAGKQNGIALSLADSLDNIFEITLDPNAVNEIQPETIQRIFQFMVDEKDAAENLLAEAEERANVIADSQKAS